MIAWQAAVHVSQRAGHDKELKMHTCLQPLTPLLPPEAGTGEDLDLGLDMVRPSIAEMSREINSKLDPGTHFNCRG